MQELQVEQEQEKIPEILYRGITMRVDDFVQTDFSLTLKPGSDEIDVDGNRVVSDGNEYGVYMSSNPNMVKTAYYSGSKESIRTEPFLRSWSRGAERVLQLPSVGIFFEIRTGNLNVRKPKIIPRLQGVANNGFVGDEYIVDELPPSNFKIKELCLATETYDKGAIVYKIEREEDYIEAKKDIIRRYQEQKSKVEQFNSEISQLSHEQRLNVKTVNSIYERIFG